MIAEADDRARILRGLDIGVHDYLVRPVDRNELVARVRTQVRRKRFAERLRDSVQTSMELAVTDPLTGLHNRRYLDSHLGGAVRGGGVARPADRRAAPRHRPLQGDQRLLWPRRRRRGAARVRGRVRAHTRGIDVVARYGGEEVVVLDAGHAARRRARPSPSASGERIGATPFPIHRGTRAIPVTVSIGVAAREAGDTTAGEMLKRADLALYRAKRQGRDRVVATAA